MFGSCECNVWFDRSSKKRNCLQDIEEATDHQRPGWDVETSYLEEKIDSFKNVRCSAEVIASFNSTKLVDAARQIREVQMTHNNIEIQTSIDEKTRQSRKPRRTIYYEQGTVDRRSNESKPSLDKEEKETRLIICEKGPQPRKRYSSVDSRRRIPRARTLDSIDPEHHTNEARRDVARAKEEMKEKD